MHFWAHISQTYLFLIFPFEWLSLCSPVGYTYFCEPIEGCCNRKCPSWWLGRLPWMVFFFFDHPHDSDDVDLINDFTGSSGVTWGNSLAPFYLSFVAIDAMSSKYTNCSMCGLGFFDDP